MANPVPRQHRQLRIHSWPFHNGLRDVSMGRGPIRLANDDEFRAGIEAEGWSVSHEEIEAVDETDPELPWDGRHVGPSLLDCVRLATERLDADGAATTAYDPAFDADGTATTAARAVAHEIARGILTQPTSPTG